MTPFDFSSIPVNILDVVALATMSFITLLYISHKFLGLLKKKDLINPSYVLYVVGLYLQFVSMIVAVSFTDTLVYSIALIISFFVLYSTYSSREHLNFTLTGTSYVEASTCTIKENANNLIVFFKRGKFDFFSLFLAAQTILTFHPSVLSVIFVTSVKFEVGFLAPLILFLSNFTIFLLSSVKIQDLCRHKYGDDGLKLLGWNNYWKQLQNSVPGGKRAAIITVGIGIGEPWINSGVNTVTSATNFLSDMAYNKTQDIACELAKETPGYDPAKYAHHRSAVPNFSLSSQLPFFKGLGKGKE